MSATEQSESLPRASAPAWSWRSFPRRYAIALLTFFGCFNMYSLRANLSMALVDMTANHTVQNENGTVSTVREFDWSRKEEGLLLGAFFYGYVATQLLGGWLAPRLGGAKLYGAGIAATAVLAVLTPPIARAGLVPLVAARVLMGVFEGVTMPAMYSLWSRWAPPLERTKMLTTGMAGTYAGTVTSMAVCGWLEQKFGWPSVFYVFGGVAVLWSLIWFSVVDESPQRDRFIKKAELDYINASLGVTSDKPAAVPWKAIFTSMPFWAIIVAHLTENWGFYTMLTQLPMFLRDVSDFSIQKTGLLAAIPYLVMSMVVLTGGQIADWLRSKHLISTTIVRKIFTCGAFAAQVIFMLATAFTDSVVAAVTCLTIAVGFGGFGWSGFSPNKMDIAPQYSSIIMGISNTFATLPGILSPILTGAILQNESASNWKIVFYVTASFYFSGCVFYGVFASAQLQPWASPADPVTETSPPSTKSMPLSAITRPVEFHFQ